MLYGRKWKSFWTKWSVCGNSYFVIELHQRTAKLNVMHAVWTNIASLFNFWVWLAPKVIKVSTLVCKKQHRPIVVKIFLFSFRYSIIRQITLTPKLKLTLPVHQCYNLKYFYFSFFSLIVDNAVQTHLCFRQILQPNLNINTRLNA